MLRQITEESGVASLWLDGRWYADSLLQPNYGALAEGRIPFVTLIQEEGARLWGLASPWSADNNRISVPSGPTSHGITYTIDTETLRTILTEWLDTLEVDMDDLPGVEEAWVKGLLAKMYQFAYRAELSKPWRPTWLSAWATCCARKAARHGGARRQARRRFLQLFLHGVQHAHYAQVFAGF